LKNRHLKIANSTNPKKPIPNSRKMLQPMPIKYFPALSTNSSEVHTQEK